MMKCLFVCVSRKIITACINGRGEGPCCRSFWRGLRRHPCLDLPPCQVQGAGCQATAGEERSTSINGSRDCNHHCLSPPSLLNLCSERAGLFPFGKAGRAGGRSSSCSGQEKSSCSAGAVVEETKTGSCSLYTTRKRYSQKGPDPLPINVSYYVICPHHHSSETEFFFGWSQWESCSPGYSVICSIDKNRDHYTKN